MSARAWCSRRGRWLALAAACAFAAPAPAVAAPSARAFGRGAGVAHPTVLPAYRIHHEDIRVGFDFAAGIVNGDATIVLTNAGPATAVALDSVGLAYAAVLLDGEPVAHRVEAAHLVLDVPADGAEHVIDATYRARPQRGVYFIRPDAAYPNREPEIWTQGEDEDTRRWFPTWDEPNMKFTTDTYVTVPQAWTVISNGARISDDAVPGGLHVVHWSEAEPHSAYLTSFVAGPYLRARDRLASLAVDFYTHPAQNAGGRVCFGHTAAMVDFLQRYTATPYPWEKYAQTTVAEFTNDGMENVSASTMDHTMLHPAAFDLEMPCDAVVVHELAHQWFGDDVTAVDWANIWINEGFATYFERAWAGRYFGHDELQLEREHARRTYFAETLRYRRPIVDDRYALSDDVFDASAYERPSLVLDMLRDLIGPAAFKRTLHDFLHAFQYANAGTRDFERVAETVSNRDLRWFFDQWFYTPGYPLCVVSDRYDAARHTLAVTVVQRDSGGTVFRMPVTLAVTAGGRRIAQTYLLDRSPQRLIVTGVPMPPAMVLFDPGAHLLRRLEFAKTPAELAYQARAAGEVPDRLWAIAALGRSPLPARPSARAAVRAVLAGEPFWGVRADALSAAAELDYADALRLALTDADPRVRIAAAAAVANLEHPGNPALVAALRRLSESPDALLRSAALGGLGATKAPAARALLLAAVGTRSPHDVVARGAVTGLGALGDPSTLPAILALTRYGVDEQTRVAAIAALAPFTDQPSTRAKTIETLCDLALHDPYFNARAAAATALGSSGPNAPARMALNAATQDPEYAVATAADAALAELASGRPARMKGR